MRCFALLAVSALLLSGCVSDSEDETPRVPEDPAAGMSATVVVAVLDTAVDPYHDHYQRNASLGDEVLARFTDADGNLPERVMLTHEGTYEERRAADAAFWDNVESGRLYYFEGTRLLAITHGGNIIDGGSHGTGTTGAVFDANPDAIVVLSQGFGEPSESWAAAQPWIDIMSESYGPLGSPPTFLVTPSSTAEANRIKWRAGGIPVGAADNTPALAPLDTTAGPPWTVGVAGDHPGSEGACREPVSGNLPDFTADFTQSLPVAGTLSEYRDMSGTSFATPMTAGSYSLALLQIRSAWDHTVGIVDGALAVSPAGDRLTNIDLRDAFNRTAVYFTTEVCTETGAVPVNPAAPWVQMGWGHVDPAVATAVADGILGRAEPATKPAAAVTYMESIHAGRKALWGP